MSTRPEKFLEDQIEAVKLARDSATPEVGAPIKVDAINIAYAVHRHGTLEGSPIDLKGMIEDAKKIEAYLRGS